MWARSSRDEMERAARVAHLHSNESASLFVRKNIKNKKENGNGRSKEGDTEGTTESDNGVQRHGVSGDYGDGFKGVDSEGVHYGQTIIIPHPTREGDTA